MYILYVFYIDLYIKEKHRNPLQVNSKDKANYVAIKTTWTTNNHKNKGFYPLKDLTILYNYVLPYYYFYLQNIVHTGSISKTYEERSQRVWPKEGIIRVLLRECKNPQQH